MSQHADITEEIVSRAIKHNWSLAETKDHYQAILGALEYDEEFKEVNNIINAVYDMLAQKDGLYGVSHKQISDWKLTNNI